MGASPANLWILLGLGIAGIILVSRRLRRAIKPDLGAFVERLELLPPPQPAPPSAPHPLTGLTFVAADIFDINGYVTGFGHPDWARTHEPASRTSQVVSDLVNGGATCTGKTVIDELAYRITGENKHFGTPTNPTDPERVPGGCSSGSAVAVAAGFADFSLGIDTIGGVRIPGGYCGVLAFRPSHAAVCSVGVIPVSPSLDAIGLFAKDPVILRRAGHVLLQLPYADLRQPRHIILADDCFGLLKIPASRVTQVVIKSVEKLFGRQLLMHVNVGDYLASKLPSLKQLQTGDCDNSKTTLQSLANAMRSQHNHEFKSNHGEWINSTKPVLDPSISKGVNSVLDHTNMECYLALRNETRAALNTLLKDDGILVLPTVLGPPPKLNSRELSSEEYLSRMSCLSAIASMSGCCQVTVPLGFQEKYPGSVSLVARHGGDRFLLDTVHTMYATIKEQADIVSKLSISSSDVSKEESAEIAKEKGNVAYKEKQWQKAINLYSEAIKLSSKHATYYSNRAAAYLELGSYIQAEADCTSAITLDPKNVKAYLRRGTAREMLGYYSEAIEDFNYALVLEPTNKTANSSLSRLKKLFQ